MLLNILCHFWPCIMVWSHFSRSIKYSIKKTSCFTSTFLKICTISIGKL